MKIITWNVNSVRTRLERVLQALQRHQPDVLCLQELKCLEKDFPREPIEALGYHCAVFGQKTYNGVAILSRQEPQKVEQGFSGNPIPQEARVLGATVAGVRIINLYVVNGQDVSSPKYDLKLQWLDALTAWVQQTYRPDQPLVLLGDFNIAPEDRDVYDPDKWRGRVLFSEPEHQRLAALTAWGVQDLLRLRHEEEEIFSWWDYRHGAFHRGWGLRIDLLLGTAPLAARTRDVWVDREERKASTGPGKPSDHAPVVLELED